MKQFKTFVVMAIAWTLIAASVTVEAQTSPRGRSRFLAQDNPRSISCHKNPDICYGPGTQGSTCCRNKCVDVTTDHHNCGACGVKCKYTDACCRGECVNLAFDKRHCGRCNNRCKKGDYCIYGLCNYV
ncbi:stigma-specific STIG1-like protein 1 [Aristolochia californica]|uniref:stigma-specific STIG1-like protein 1 n=1 Tax=Aristolochia californica TaxID=171875 RepID=UPI0035D52BF2